jgi:hypothetical protein
LLYWYKSSNTDVPLAAAEMPQGFVRVMLNDDGEEEEEFVLDLEAAADGSAAARQTGVVCFTVNEVSWRLLKIRKPHAS